MGYATVQQVRDLLGSSAGSPNPSDTIIGVFIENAEGEVDTSTGRTFNFNPTGATLTGEQKLVRKVATEIAAVMTLSNVAGNNLTTSTTFSLGEFSVNPGGNLSAHETRISALKDDINKDLQKLGRKTLVRQTFY